MILALKQEKPILEFELGETEKKAQIGDKVIVALTSAFPDNYSLSLITDMKFKRITNFEWELTVEDSDPHEIKVHAVDRKSKSYEKYSNTLTLNRI